MTEQRPADDSPAQSWESVLSAVEDDLRRTEALLAGRAAPAAIHTVGAPAEGMLPSGSATAASTKPIDAGWAELPPFEKMPPVPAELAERIRELRANILAIQVEITAEMAAWRRSCAQRSRDTVAPVASGTAFFVDRRL